MRKLHWAIGEGLLVSLAFLAGCDHAGQTSAPSRAEQTESSVAVRPTPSPEQTPPAEPAPVEDRQQPVAEEGAASEPPPSEARLAEKFTDTSGDALSMPPVVLSHAHSKLARVKVGDQLPDVELPDLDGKSRRLDSLLGAKLTVVVFWGSTSRASLEELGDLGPEVIKRFGNYGVAVVGIDERDEPQRARELAKRVGATFPLLSDREGTTLRSVGPPRPPVTYLVGHARTVLWFDIEYSHTTRRDLQQAIRYALAHP